MSRQFFARQCWTPCRHHTTALGARSTEALVRRCGCFDFLPHSKSKHGRLRKFEDMNSCLGLILDNSYWTLRHSVVRVADDTDTHAHVTAHNHAAWRRIAIRCADQLLGINLMHDDCGPHTESGNSRTASEEHDTSTLTFYNAHVVSAISCAAALP